MSRFPRQYDDTKHQLKTIQKIEHNLAYMDYAMLRQASRFVCFQRMKR